ncbi:hypothetical protein BROUX41_006165 [Berkeleyomyces rouxiae]|uniref:uncharacterized protein n=1 Tax=Berkeleyomyces rouxiae TaxID=2035830 RepID=UPI003B7B289F
MRFSLATIIAASAVLAAPSNMADTKTLATRGNTHVVTVKDELFSPTSLEAGVGDTVRFEFGVGFQSVVEADFETPCYPKSGGFASGKFITPPSDIKNSEVYEIDITNEDPIWLYNGMNGNCHKKSAVFVINSHNVQGRSYSDFAFKSVNARTTKNAKQNRGRVVSRD